MDFFDNNTLLYIGLIVLFLGFFFWNTKRTKKNREAKKNRNFRRRYEERKREKENERDDEDDVRGPKTPFPPD